MIGEPWRFSTANQRLQTLQLFPIGRVHGTEVHRYAMLNDFVLLQNAIESRKRRPTINHVIFRNDFEPINHRFMLEPDWDRQRELFKQLLKN
jgi:hypothetical protein